MRVVKKENQRVATIGVDLSLKERTRLTNINGKQTAFLVSVDFVGWLQLLRQI